MAEIGVPRGGVDALDRAQQGGDVLAPAEQAADRPGDLGGRQDRGRHLIEQRLDQVVVALLDQRGPGAGPLQPLDGLQTAKARADDNDMTGFRA